MKTKNHLILICTLATLLLLSTSQSFAQQETGFGFGVKIGSNFADYKNSNGNSRIGIYGGAMVDYHLTPRWGIESGVYFSQQGNRNNAESGYVVSGSEGRTDHLMDYISVPLQLKFVVIGGFRVYAGAQAAYLISAKRRIKYADGSKFESIPSKDVRPFDISANMGVGYNFKIGLDLAASYSVGFTDVLTYTKQNNTTNIFRVTVGWRFATKRK